jgi:crotonobetainyl-CoA:carnitine CoA-transferase CaiB-like acyl-CoA transferase
MVANEEGAGGGGGGGGCGGGGAGGGGGAQGGEGGADQPLRGIRVVELGIWVAGPAAAGVMADWGADVIKVESPDGDPMRRVFQLIVGHGQPESPPFDLDNRGKRSVVLDLATDEGREAARRLVASADVFLTNLRPDALDRLGLAHEALLTEHPRLVYCSVTGYGLTGDDRGRAGYDVGAFWARSGIPHLMAPVGEPPPAIRGGMGDHITGLAALSGVLGALLARERTGRGGLVEASLLRTGMYAVGWDLGIQARFGKLAPTAPRTSEMNPALNSYRAADDRWFWLLGVESDRHFPPLCRAVGHPEWMSDDRFATARGRRKAAAEVIAALDEVFATRPRHEWIDRFDAEGVWWAPVNTAADALADSQALAAGAVVDVPEGAGAPAHQAIASPIRFDGAAVAPGGVPGLGEHTAEVLAELGLPTP